MSRFFKPAEKDPVTAEPMPEKLSDAVFVAPKKVLNNTVPIEDADLCIIYFKGKHSNWDAVIEEHEGKNITEQSVQKLFNKTYKNVGHYYVDSISWDDIRDKDVVIRYDNPEWIHGTEWIVRSGKVDILNENLINGYNVCMFVPTEPHTRTDARRLSTHFVNSKNLWLVNTNAEIFQYNRAGVSVCFIDYFSAWLYSGKKLYSSQQAEFVSPPKDYLCLMLTMRPYKQRLFDCLQQNQVLEHGYVSTNKRPIDLLDYSIKHATTSDIRSMLGKYSKHPSFHNITPFTNAVHFELIVEDAGPTSFGRDVDNNYMFVSEKTYRSVYNKLPFIVYGKQHILKYIKALGYCTFPELFDESYDDIEDNVQRAKEIAKQVKIFCEKSESEKKKLIESVQHKIEHNYDFLSRPENRARLFTEPLNISNTHKQEKK